MTIPTRGASCYVFPHLRSPICGKAANCASFFRLDMAPVGHISIDGTMRYFAVGQVGFDGGEGVTGASEWG